MPINQSSLYDSNTALSLQETIHLFIGVDQSQYVAAQVLAYSIRRHTSRPLRIHYLNSANIKQPQRPENRQRTGFSFARFLIPQKMNFKGKAVYLDADMLVFSDIGALWDMPMNGFKVLCASATEVPQGWQDRKRADFRPGRQMSVLLMDCSRLDWQIEKIIRDLDEGLYSYNQLMFDSCLLSENEINAALPFEWNSLEQYREGRTHLLHYTVGHTQPWLFKKNPSGSVWLKMYQEALQAGALSAGAVERAVRAGFVHPYLLGFLEPRGFLRNLKSVSGYGHSRLSHAFQKRVSFSKQGGQADQVRILAARGASGSSFLIKAFQAKELEIDPRPDNCFLPADHPVQSKAQRLTAEGYQDKPDRRGCELFYERSGFRFNPAKSIEHNMTRYIASIPAQDKFTLLNRASYFQFFSRNRIRNVAFLIRHPLQAYLSLTKEERHPELVRDSGGRDSEESIRYFAGRWNAHAEEYLACRDLGLNPRLIRYEYAHEDVLTEAPDLAGLFEFWKASAWIEPASTAFNEVLKKITQAAYQKIYADWNLCDEV